MSKQFECQFCEKESEEANVIVENENYYVVCDDCAQKVNSRTCRICGRKHIDKSFHGMCIECAQVESLQEEYDREYMETPYDTTKCTEEEDQKALDVFMSFGSKYSDKQIDDNRVNYIKRKYKDRINLVQIEMNEEDIKKVLKDNFREVFQGNLILMITANRKADIEDKGKIIVKKSGNVYLVRK